jgi:protein SCO1
MKLGQPINETLIFRNAAKMEAENPWRSRLATAAVSTRATQAMSTSMARLIRVVAWGGVAGVAIAAGFLYLRSPDQGRFQLPVTSSIGGPFTLITAADKPFSSEMLKGRPYVLFFGFTNCSDVCPTTLLEMSNALAALGPDADRLTMLFVTVDPERDTAEHLKTYLAAFDPRIIGLTGTATDIASVARAYHVFYEKVPTSSGYTMNHTATIFLMDRKGALASTTNHEEPEAVQHNKLRRLLTR